MIVTRFAPSPNGPLHMGHAYSAINAHDLAKAAGGRFLLRLEDIDGARSQPELAEAFRKDLEWLGLEWEEVPAQSKRLDMYQQAADRLKAMGLLYPCQCTRAQIAETSQKTGRGTDPEGPIYAGTCKNAQLDPELPYAWRLDVAAAMEHTGPLQWTDELAGVQPARPLNLGDVVLLRKEAPASYHLAATLDDATDGVTLVTRGRDLFSATHVHRLLQSLLDLPVPRWHHHALIVETGPDGQSRKLAKRRGSQSLQDMRDAEVDGAKIAMAVRSGRFPIGMSLLKD